MNISDEQLGSVLELKELSFDQTGDPFVDTGGLVLKRLIKQFPDKSLSEHFEFVTTTYIEKWNKKLHAIFHTNSKLLNPSTPGKHKENTLQYLRELREHLNQDDSIRGYCKTCGKRSILYQNSREFFPLTGSGAYLNFHHFHEKGSYLCSECSIKLYFLPLGVLQLGGSIGLLRGQSKYAKDFVSNKIIQENLNKISIDASEGILKSPIRNPKNALFEFAANIISDVGNEDFEEFLQLFHFTNFGASPACDIYSLPHPVFSFLNRVINYYRKDWDYFINRYFFIKNAEWSKENKSWYTKSKQNPFKIEKQDYVNNPNQIYERLLSGQSILRQLYRIYKEHFYQNSESFQIMLAIYYAQEVLNMTNEQLKLIRKIADAVFELSRRENNYKKYLTMLEGAGKAYQLRSTLLRIVKTNFLRGEKEPLIRLEDYVNYLFPDGQYWGEVRDLLLIHLYEKLHDEGVNTDQIPEDNIQETIEEPNETL